MISFDGPLVSIIIPAYNVANYIKESIQSVLVQTYRNFEIIVVNDGSTDQTSQILSDIDSIQLFNTPNRGAASARNFGISKARGEYIAFLDADDIWLPEKLEKQLKLFQNNDQLGLVFTETIGFDEEGFREPLFSKTKLLEGDVVKNIFLMSNVATPSVMLRSKVLSTVGVFEEGLIVAEDDNLWMRIADKYPIALVDEVLVYCRFRTGSLTSTPGNFLEGVLGHIELLKTKYPDIYRRLGNKAIQSKKSYCYFNQGYSLFSRDLNFESRKFFVKSIFCRLSKKSISYLFLSFVPVCFKNSLKKIKNKYSINLPI